MRLRPASWLLPALLLVSACGGGAVQPPAAAPGPTGVAPSAPEPGWRWESYGGVEVQVPQEWEGTTAGAAGYGAWCLSEDGPAPGVNRGRLMAVPAVGCPDRRPASSYARALELGAGSPSGRQVLAGPWVVETVEVAGVALAVTSDDEGLRERVLASARPVRDGTDAQGCALDSGLREAGARPDRDGVLEPDAVVAVVACRYLLPRSTMATDVPEPLVASVRWSGADAVALVEALLAAPPGSGPDDDSRCAPCSRLGEELLVLRVDDGARTQEVVVRYSGCGGNGTDDGTTVRRLTEDLLQPLLVGPLAPSSLSGGVSGLVW